jgi:hypothetical protein
LYSKKVLKGMIKMFEKEIKMKRIKENRIV